MDTRIKMNIKNYYLKMGISVAASVILTISSCSAYLNNISDNTKSTAQKQYFSEKTFSAVKNPTDEKGFAKIEWILYKDNEKTINGEHPIKDAQKSLEELVFTDIGSLERELTEWEMPSLARLIPLKRLIERDSAHYSINPMWATMFFTFESCLNPTDENKMSNDYGLGQIKRSSEELAKTMGTNTKHPFYSPHLNKEKSIYDPETNIIMAMILHRYNIERYNLQNSDQTYAIYVRGAPGLNHDGTLSHWTKDVLDAYRQRYNYYRNIIPLFRLAKDKLDKIRNKDTKSLLQIYHENLGIEETYKRELDYFLGELENNLKGDARCVLIYDDCLTFAKTISVISSIKQTNAYGRLLAVGNKLSALVEHPDLKQRAEKTTNLLIEALGSDAEAAIQKILAQKVPTTSMLETSIAATSTPETEQQYFSEKTFSAVKNPIDEKGFAKIEWILYKDNEKTINGEHPIKDAPKSLEQLVFTDVDPLERELTEWEMPSLARLIPLKRLIERDSAQYSINPMWALTFMNLQSFLDPTTSNADNLGLGRINSTNEELAKLQATNPASQLYSPRLNKEKSIFDPETNITIALMLNRYNTERYHLQNSDQAYAIYVSDPRGLNPDGSLTPQTQDALNAFYQRYNYYRNIIPLFRLAKDKLDKIRNKDTKSLLQIYHENLGIEETYKRELDYFLGELENNLKGDARCVLIYDDCLTFAKTINVISSVKQTNAYERLLAVGNKLLALVEHADLKSRVERTTNLLIKAQKSN